MLTRRTTTTTATVAAATTIAAAVILLTPSPDDTAAAGIDPTATATAGPTPPDEPPSTPMTASMAAAPTPTAATTTAPTPTTPPDPTRSHDPSHGPHDPDHMHSHSAPPDDVVAGQGPDTPLEQLAVDRLLADATGIGRDLWPDLDALPCCTGAAIAITGVTTLADGDTATVVIAWTANNTARTTTSRWHHTGNDMWEPQP